MLKDLFRLSRKTEKNDQNKIIDEIMGFVDSNDLFPDLRELESAVEPEVQIGDKKILIFASNNYLGLATDPRLKESAIECIKEFGVGATGSRLLTGNLLPHVKLEKRLAEFKKGEDAIIFPTGFAANLGTISAIMNPLRVSLSMFFNNKGIIFSDSLNHASIVDGIKMSGQEKAIYRHCDMEHLESLLKKHPLSVRKLIVTDSVFSMDGDIAPLDKISELGKKYNAMTMIDEAHAVGVLGENGGGCMEHFNLKAGEDITIVMGTLSKAIGSSGGYVVGNKEMIRYLRIAARAYMFSTAMLPAASAAAYEALNIIESDKKSRLKLWSNINYTKNLFSEKGFKVINGESAIIPILIGNEKDSIDISRKLFERNIFAPSVRWPVVPRGESRLRITITSSHSFEQIERLVKELSDVADEIKLAKIQ